VIGDGNNNNGSRNLEEVLELAKRKQVTIYGMSTVSYGSDNPNRETLERLASETGGRVEYPLGPQLYKDISGFISKPMDAGNYVYEAGTGGYAGEVSRAIINSVANLQGNITTQYVLRYVPDIDPGASEKAFRKIKVELVNPATNEQLPMKDEKGKPIKYSIVAKAGYKASRAVE